MKRIILLILLTNLLRINSIFPQTGTFDFYTGATGDGQSISQTVSGVTLTIYSDHSDTPPSMTLQDWSAYPPFTNDAATMNGIAKNSCTFSFSQPVNIATIIVADFNGGFPHLLFTPNTGSSYNTTITNSNGDVVTLNFIHITSFVITNFVGGTVNLGFDDVHMDGSLPVELTSFTSNIFSNGIELRWQTATEVNNYGFEVERTTIDNRQTSSMSWEKIGFIRGHGNSNSLQNYSYIDLTAYGAEYNYRLKQIDNDGKFTYSKIIEALFVKPVKFDLSQNYPNPFNPTTLISFQLPEDNFVTLKIYNIIGKEIKNLVNGETTAGEHKIIWDGKDNFGNEVTSGIYFYSINFNGQSITKKMLLIR